MLAELICKEKSSELQEKIALHLSKAKCYSIDESFSVEYAAGVLRVKAKHALGLAYGSAQTTMLARGGYRAELQREIAPRFPVRPVWLGAKKAVKVTTKTTLCIPPCLDPQQFRDKTDIVKGARRIARQCIEWGFNTLVLGPKPHEEAPTELTDDLDTVKALLAEFRSYGLKIMVHPHITDHDPLPAIASFLKELDSGDFLFWESAPTTEEDQESLLFDIITAELNALEQTIQGKARLVYFLPTTSKEEGEEQADLIQRLCDEAGDGTIIAFSPVIGDPCHGSHEIHPIWEALRLSPDESATPLLPILNAGLIGQGEGLWPALPLEEYNRFFGRLFRHHFAGTLVMANAMPSPKGFLDANLWIAGHMMWHSFPAELLAEIWFAVRRSDLNFEKLRPVIQTVTHITAEAMGLLALADGGPKEENTEIIRSKVEALLAQLRSLHAIFIANEGAGDDFKKFEDYLTFFLRDMKKLLLYVLQAFSVPMASVLNGDDMLESFWTSMASEPSKRIGAGASVALLNEPYPGEDKSPMRRIFDENCI